MIVSHCKICDKIISMDNTIISAVFSSAYLPPIEYFFQLIKHQNVFIETDESYPKQTYRNRCYILGTNGKQSLSIPVIKVNGNHTKTKDIRISYDLDWRKNHWKSIESAYNSSPFFLYYQDEIRPFYQKKFDFLLDFNMQLIKLIKNILSIQTIIKPTEKFIKEANNDFRYTISPKIESEFEKNSPKEYFQVFSDKHSFVPNLSIIDLLFNEGPASLDYLK